MWVSAMPKLTGCPISFELVLVVGKCVTRVDRLAIRVSFAWECFIKFIARVEPWGSLEPDRWT